MTVTGTKCQERRPLNRLSLAMNEFAETAAQLAEDDFVRRPAETNVGLAAKEKPAGLRRRALINSLAA